jgi:hypothetical protein
LLPLFLQCAAPNRRLALLIEDQGMSLQRLNFALLASFALLSAGAAKAADYSPPPPMIVQPVEEFASSWYLRGDIGVSTQSVASLSNANYALYDSITNAQKGFDSAPFFGVGMGYNFNSWLRFDGTVEYRAKANFHGFDVGSKNGAFADDRYSASKSEVLVLFNAYLDLGTWNCLTPFVGVCRSTPSPGSPATCTAPIPAWSMRVVNEVLLFASERSDLRAKGQSCVACTCC